MTAVSTENPRKDIKSNGTADVGEESILPNHTVSLPDLCAHIYQRIHDFLEQDVGDERLQSLQKQTRISLDVISKALRDYDISQLSLSYNGGKDCLVLLILYLAALHRNKTFSQSANTPQISSVQSVYIQSSNPFDEVESFVASSKKTYFLTLATYSGSMKASFADYLQDHPSVKAIFVGTRRTDPHGADLTHFDRTDHGWPDFIRIHPVIDWHYVDIWTFIRHLQIPYCSLYDLGYTSLGGTTDTHPNPALQMQPLAGGPASTGTAMFRPAYELVEDEQERLGREKAAQIQSAKTT